jgi:hypothetical protein
MHHSWCPDRASFIATWLTLPLARFSLAVTGIELAPGEEDINPSAIIIPSVEMVGPITRS